MQPEDRDAAHLWDMQRAAQEVLEFLREVPYEQFSSDRLVRYAVERQLITLGEAAKRLSATFREAHPEVPWLSIIGQRNVLAHEYGEILVERVWRTARENVPELVRRLDAFLSDPPDGESC